MPFLFISTAFFSSIALLGTPKRALAGIKKSISRLYFELVNNFNVK